MPDEYRAKILEEAAQKCDAYLARRKQTLVEIYGDDKLSLLNPSGQSEEINQAKAYGELYAYQELGRAIRNLAAKPDDSPIIENWNNDEAVVENILDGAKLMFYNHDKQ